MEARVRARRAGREHRADHLSARDLFGTDEPEPEARHVTIGALSFQLIGGNIRCVRFGGHEILPAIDYLVRDRDWGTLAPTLSGLTIAEGDAIRIEYRAACTDHDGARLVYRTLIVATERAVEMTVEAEAVDDFLTSRLGFCVLHDARLAGTALTVEHGDGSVERSEFPERIEPWQPFTDIRALTHRQAGLTVECRLEGDEFEMEDQRNWSDASYKTYVRPLARPWPYVVPGGSVVRQRVSLRIDGTPATTTGARGPVLVTVGETIGVMPRIGLVVTPAEAAATRRAEQHFALLGVQDLLLSVDAARDGPAEFAALARATNGFGGRRTLECVISADSDLDEELAGVAARVARAGLMLDGVAVFPRPDLQSTPPGSEWPPCPPFAAIHAAARRAFPGLVLGGGMFSYFTELNRKRAPAGEIDFVTHATCPIVHAADDRSVMRSLAAIPHILRSARALYPQTPYRLGPITIGMRQNPYGARTMPNPDRRRFPMATVDPRQDGRFAAAWTAGYAAMTEDGAIDTLTLGALTGPLGVIGPDGPRPIYETVRLLAAMAGQPRRECRVGAPDRVAALHGGGTLVIANLTPDPCAVDAPGGQLSLAPFEVRAI